MLNNYVNLPERQHRVQRVADQFNADERHWRNLEKRRTLRRRLLKRLTEQELKALDQLEFSRTRPLDDCIGEMDEGRVG